MEYNEFDPASPETPETKGSAAKRSKDYLARKKKAGIVVNTPADIRYSGIKLDSSMEQEAKKIVSSLSNEIGDKVKRVFITKKTIQPGVPESGGSSIIFKVEFLESPTFVGAILRDPADMPKAGGTGFNVAEVMRETPSIKTVFITADGKVKQLIDDNLVSSETKDAIKKFLISLSQYMDAGTPAKMRNTAYSQSNVNRQQEEFKQRISEIAAKIAGINEEYEKGKINLPDSFKARVNSAVANQKDMAQFILDMMQEIIAGESSMKNIEKMSGWNSISTMLKKLAGESATQGDQTPDVSSSDQDKLALPDLKEAFERINKK